LAISSFPISRPFTICTAEPSTSGGGLNQAAGFDCKKAGV
jgi:hypothetical protein